MQEIISGFGCWTIYEKNGDWLDDMLGFVDLDKMLFFETDKNGNLTSNTINLQEMSRWERVN